jgi:phosphoribosylaminoimidazole-succinocarboxamide synthase
VSDAATLEGHQLLASGKVREIYDEGDRLLMVASDRISTYDVIHPTPIPRKGAVLTGISAFWFDRTEQIVPNHVVSYTDGVPDQVRGRAMLVDRLQMFPVECVVRGYITGSGWKDYQQTGAVCGIELPEGLRESDRLPEPIFTPAFKASAGQHDENITFERMTQLVGLENATALRDLSLKVFERASAVAEAKGVILADTKFEFGVTDGVITLGDEVLTSDSSRYWDAAAYAAGNRGQSFDKQPVRDWLKAHWNGEGEPPELDPSVVSATSNRYRELLDRLTR